MAYRAGHKENDWPDGVDPASRVIAVNDRLMTQPRAAMVVALIAAPAPLNETPPSEDGRVGEAQIAADSPRAPRGATALLTGGAAGAGGAKRARDAGAMSRVA